MLERKIKTSTCPNERIISLTIIKALKPFLIAIHLFLFSRSFSLSLCITLVSCLRILFSSCCLNFPFYIIIHTHTRMQSIFESNETKVENVFGWYRWWFILNVNSCRLMFYRRKITGFLPFNLWLSPPPHPPANLSISNFSIFSQRTKQLNILFFLCYFCLSVAFRLGVCWCENPCLFLHRQCGEKTNQLNANYFQLISLQIYYFFSIKYK